MKFKYWLLITVVPVFFGCKKDKPDEVIPVDNESVSFYVPPGFPQPVYDFQNNPLTQEGFQLGRKLFYDPLLSSDNSVSCGSCHQQFVAFAHADHNVSHGVNGLLGTRNAPPMFNLAWHSEFFWDGGSNHLETQPIGPLTNPVEMDETIANVIQKLKNTTVYPQLFKSAFGSDSITSQNMLRALAQFTAVLISADSKYDRYMQGNESFTPQEVSGLQLFRQHCESCHKEPLFTDLQYRNNGLDQVFTDAGRAIITQLPSDSGKFKVPSLRNVVLSYPYMHDGRFKNLNLVLDHYISGVKQSSTVDPLISNGIPLNAQEKSDIISFLQTLTDTKFTTDHRFSEVH